MSLLSKVENSILVLLIEDELDMFIDLKRLQENPDIASNRLNQTFERLNLDKAFSLINSCETVDKVNLPFAFTHKHPR